MCTGESAGESCAEWVDRRWLDVSSWLINGVRSTTCSQGRCTACTIHDIFTGRHDLVVFSVLDYKYFHFYRPRMQHSNALECICLSVLLWSLDLQTSFSVRVHSWVSRSLDEGQDEGIKIGQTCIHTRGVPSIERQSCLLLSSPQDVYDSTRCLKQSFHF